MYIYIYIYCYMYLYKYYVIMYTNIYMDLKIFTCLNLTALPLCFYIFDIFDIVKVTFLK